MHAPRMHDFFLGGCFGRGDREKGPPLGDPPRGDPIGVDADARAVAKQDVPSPARAAAEVDAAAGAQSSSRSPTTGVAATSSLPQQPPAVCMAPSLSTQANVMQCSPFIVTALALDGSTVYQNRNSIRFYGDIARCIQTTPEHQRSRVMQGLPTALLHRLFLLEGDQHLQQVLELLEQGPHIGCRVDDDDEDDAAAWSRVIRVPTNCNGASASASCQQLMDLALPASPSCQQLMLDLALPASSDKHHDSPAPPAGAHAPLTPVSCQQLMDLALPAPVSCQQPDDLPARPHPSHSGEGRVCPPAAAQSPSPGDLDLGQLKLTLRAARASSSPLIMPSGSGAAGAGAAATSSTGAEGSAAEIRPGSPRGHFPGCSSGGHTQQESVDGAVIISGISGNTASCGRATWHPTPSSSTAECAGPGVGCRVSRRVQSLLNFSLSHRTGSTGSSPRSNAASGGSCAAAAGTAGSIPSSVLKSSRSLGRCSARGRQQRPLPSASACGLVRGAESGDTTWTPDLASVSKAAPAGGQLGLLRLGSVGSDPQHMSSTVRSCAEAASWRVDCRSLAAAGRPPLPPLGDACLLDLLAEGSRSGDCTGFISQEQAPPLPPGIALLSSPRGPAARCGASVLPSLVESHESLKAPCVSQRPGLLQPHLGGTSRASSLSSASEDPTARVEEEQECSWHDVTISRARDATDGKELLLISQSDVTALTRLETMLAKLADMQLNTLCQIFPRHIIEFLSSDLSVRMDARDLTHLARSHQDISILFMDIVGFTSMSKQVAPAAVMAFLNSLFSAFDALCELHNVHKVETAGDCYIVSSGVVVMDEEGFHQVQADHDPRQSTERVVAFAKDMLTSSRKVLMPHDGSPVVIRIGVHTGSCVSGIVGSKLPKFGIFGDTMNTASRMESTCTPGRIQISASTRSLLTDNGHPGSLEAEWCPTGGIEVKGKGIMETFMWREPEGSGCRPGGPEQDLGLGLGPEDLGLSLNAPEVLAASRSELHEGQEVPQPPPGGTASEGVGGTRLEGAAPSGDWGRRWRQALRRQVEGLGREVARAPLGKHLSQGAEILRSKLVSRLGSAQW